MYGDVDGIAVKDVVPHKLLLLLIELFVDGAIVANDGERVCAALELCSDLIERGVCDLIDGGVCAPPVIIDDELESSSLSLSNVL